MRQRRGGLSGPGTPPGRKGLLCGAAVQAARGPGSRAAALSRTNEDGCWSRDPRVLRKHGAQEPRGAQAVFRNQAGNMAGSQQRTRPGSARRPRHFLPPSQERPAFPKARAPAHTSPSPVRCFKGQRVAKAEGVSATTCRVLGGHHVTAGPRLPPDRTRSCCCWVPSPLQSSWGMTSPPPRTRERHRFFPKEQTELHEPWRAPVSFAGSTLPSPRVTAQSSQPARWGQTSAATQRRDEASTAEQGCTGPGTPLLSWGPPWPWGSMNMLPPLGVHQTDLSVL